MRVEILDSESLLPEPDVLSSPFTEAVTPRSDRSIRSVYTLGEFTLCIYAHACMYTQLAISRRIQLAQVSLAQRNYVPSSQRN
jgi:hypothetical protein